MSAHKLAALKDLVSTMKSRSQDNLKMRKPMVSIHIEKHADEQPEDSMLHSKMAAPLDPASEESELSIPGDDVEGRRAMMKRFGK